MNWAFAAIDGNGGWPKGGRNLHITPESYRPQSHGIARLVFLGELHCPRNARTFRVLCVRHDRLSRAKLYPVACAPARQEARLRTPSVRPLRLMTRFHVASAFCGFEAFLAAGFLAFSELAEVFAGVRRGACCFFLLRWTRSFFVADRFACCLRLLILLSVVSS